MIAREVAESISEIIGCSVTGFRAALTVRSRSGKLTYEAYANYDPESEELVVQNPYRGGGATITFRREFAERVVTL